MDTSNHNELTREFVMKVAGQTKNHAELMVVIESCILATMEILNQGYGMSRPNSAVMIDEAVHAATERYVRGGPS